MSSSYNFDEIVNLLGQRSGEMQVESLNGITLAEAAKIVIEEWSDYQKLSMFIVRDGEPIRTYAEIDAVYKHPAFPLDRKPS